MNKSTETPVFYDVTGKRWQRIQTIIASAGFALLVLLALVIPKILQPTALPVRAPAGQTVFATPKTAASLPPQPGEYMFSDLRPLDSDAASRLSFANYPLMDTQPRPATSLSPAELAYSINRPQMPIIGDGPLMRVVKVEHQKQQTVVSDPFTGAVTKELNQLEIQTVGDYNYVIEKYGETANKKIALTFDDGPDAVYSPELLNLLAAEHAPSTFFVIGNSIVKNPAIANRMVREGHILGNHTLTHIDFDFYNGFRSAQEMVQTDRLMRAVTGYSSGYVRLPYGGNDDKSIRDNVRGILEAQRLGYTVASYHFDTNDWAFPYGAVPKFPSFDGGDKVLLLHDGGGNRLETLQYVEQLIKAAKAAGYTFTTLDGLYTGVNRPQFVRTGRSSADLAAMAISSAIYVWPRTALSILFYITLATISVTSVLNVLLALIQTVRIRFTRHRWERNKDYRPLVSVIVPAYNEEKVVQKTVSSLLRSKYKHLEILLVDDGSKDRTWEIMQRVARRSKRVHAFTKPNGGKSSALNLGIELAKGDIFIAMDADTIFLPETIGNLVRHFADPKVGAVAGVVKVGNIRNLLTTWQSLEYITGINISRTAHALMNSITIVPGACGAWRKQAVVEAGGFSSITLAEDCDLTLMVRKIGYDIRQDTEAVSLTESPEKMKDLAKQRYRWVFGNMQSLYRHRDMLFKRRYGWLGMFVLPNVIISILFPLLFVPLLFSITVENLLAGQFLTLAFYFVITLIIQFFLSLIGILLAGESLRQLWAVPVARVLYGPLRSYLLYRSTLQVVKGANVGWNKLARTGTVRYRETMLPQPATVTSTV